VEEFLRVALAEDLGDRGDVTSQATVPASAVASAEVVAREHGCIAGLDVALKVFSLVDDGLVVQMLSANGSGVEAGTVVARIDGNAQSILAAERVGLNLLGRLSGIATATRAFVARVEGTNATIVDTRKTTPGLRALEKAAVRAGGGENHRMGLFDAVLIKDNHIRAVGSAAEAVRDARAFVGPDVCVEVEIGELAELEAVIEAGADIVMLDNMDVTTMREAVERTAGRCKIEASGGVTLDTVRAVAETGVDIISVGWITHSAPVLDVALDFRG
jgi:nicotinate-nucleotide pyrophosphorylase (carboxylating)